MKRIINFKISKVQIKKSTKINQIIYILDGYNILFYNMGKIKMEKNKT